MHNLFIATMVVLLSSVVFSLGGLINAIYANKFDDVTIVPTFILTPLIYLGGVFYSIDLLPDFWKAVSHINPIFYMVDALQQRLNNYPGLQFEYLGKPLILVTDNPWSPVNETRISQLSQNYTIRRMWGLYPDGGSNWSFMQSCKESPLHNRPCSQRSVSSGGGIEQVAISIAYQATYMTNTATATPKHQGKTFRQQFETLINNPEAAIATITGWNEWISQRQQCDTVDMCPCTSFPDGCFLDAWNIEYNRDIEPGVNAMGDYYYRLAKACIKLFRDGKRCDYQNADNLCCKDYQ